MILPLFRRCTTVRDVAAFVKHRAFSFLAVPHARRHVDDAIDDDIDHDKDYADNNHDGNDDAHGRQDSVQAMFLSERSYSLIR